VATILFANVAACQGSVAFFKTGRSRTEHSGVHRVRLLRALTTACTGIAVALSDAAPAWTTAHQNPAKRRRKAE